MITFLLIFTFVFGVIRLISYTYLFKNNLVGLFEMINPFPETYPVFIYLDYLIFYFSIAYQSWFWIFRHINF